MSLMSIIKGRRGANGFGYASTAEEVTDGVDLAGKHILVTGVGSGLGQESARVLAKRGATILAAARTETKAAEACRSFGKSTIPVACELSDPASVRACVERVKREGTKLDALLCNAGIMALPKRETKHGQELQFFTNHVGHFMLVTGLLGELKDGGRVVMLSSDAHTMAPKPGIQFDDLAFEKSYAPWKAYGQSKLANLLFARSLARKLDGTGKTANAVHPGVIATNLGRHMPAIARGALGLASSAFLKSVGEGAATQCLVTAHPSVANVSGEYFADCNVAKSSRHGHDAAMGDRLWAVTEEIVAKL